MSLLRMGKSSESVRCLDDVDLTFTLDSRASSAQQMTSIEITTEPIVFRASYRDINMITVIINQMISLYGNTQQSGLPLANDSSPRSNVISRGPAELSTMKPNQSHTIGKARVLMAKEQVNTSCSQSNRKANISQLKGTFGGFRLVLIGDIHEQPILNFKVKSFLARAQDWSGQVRPHRSTPYNIADDLTAPCHDNNGDSDKLLEFNKFALGTM
jgi:vacuolar protein sorting-associated protein 13A/C